MKQTRPLFRRLFARLFRENIQHEARALLTESENQFLVGVQRVGETSRDRMGADREEILADALEAWRLNPLARRIVGLTSQYVVGGGIQINCSHAPTARFIEDFWHNRLNRMPVRVYEWCDELTRSGNLFILVTTDVTGMSYVRSIPAADIDQIITRPNDIEQPISFTTKADTVTMETSTWKAYDPSEIGSNLAGAGRSQPSNGGFFDPVMLHYAINRPVGGVWGESDLAPLLKWLSRYSSWLDDRARLNRFRNAFLYVVKARFTSEAERLARQNVLATNPPTPGSILVTDENEEWTVLSPELNSGEASTDGLALKKMIASGAGVPLHFLAEPESATRTTAEAAGGPTYRHFEQRQNYFCWLVSDVLQVIVARRAQVDHRVNRQARIEVVGGDISARDNISLSMAASNIANVFNGLRDRGLISDEELLRLVYRFAGETLDLANAGAKPSNPEARTQPVTTQPKGGKEVDIQTGEPKKTMDLLWQAHREFSGKTR